MKTDVIVSYFKCALSGKYRFLVDFFYKSPVRDSEVWKKRPLMYPSDIQVIQYGSIFPHRIKDHYNHCFLYLAYFLKPFSTNVSSGITEWGMPPMATLSTGWQSKAAQEPNSVLRPRVDGLWVHLFPSVANIWKVFSCFKDFFKEVCPRLGKRTWDLLGFCLFSLASSDLDHFFSPSTGDAEHQFHTECWVPTERYRE